MSEAIKATESSTADDLRRTAQAIGLGRLSEEQLAQLARASSALRRHLDRLPHDLPAVAEPAHVFRPLPPRG